MSQAGEVTMLTDPVSGGCTRQHLGEPGVADAGRRERICPLAVTYSPPTAPGGMTVMANRRFCSVR